MCTVCYNEDCHTYFAHDPNDDNKVKDICESCLGTPEYLQDCPHCGAQIAVN